MGRIGKKLALAAIWLLFIFLLLEGAGFAFFNLLKMDTVTRYGYPAGLFAPHAELGYLYTPGFRGKFTGRAYGDIDIAINEHGFRDDSFNTASEGLRIAILGDSVVFGAGVEKSQRFTEQLESSGFGAGRNLEVVNLGVNSYTFTHYLTLAKLNFLNLKPDVVVVGFTLNDIAAIDEDDGPARQLAKTGLSAHDSALTRARKALDRTYAGLFIAELKTRLRMAAASKPQQDYHTAWMRSVDAQWKKASERLRLFGEIAEFDTLLKQRQTPYLLLLFPELNTLLSPQEFAYPRATLRAYLDKQGIRYCDMYDDFAAYSGDKHALFLNSDSVHFTPAGHALAAARLRVCLSGMLK